MKKGSGFHLDLLLVGVAGVYLGLLGLPFMVCAAVKSITHVSALSVYSTSYAPGEKPQLLGVLEQRVTTVLVGLLIGERWFRNNASVSCFTPASAI